MYVGFIFNLLSWGFISTVGWLLPPLTRTIKRASLDPGASCGRRLRALGPRASLYRPPNSSASAAMLSSTFCHAARRCASSSSSEEEEESELSSPKPGKAMETCPEATPTGQNAKKWEIARSGANVSRADSRLFWQSINQPFGSNVNPGREPSKTVGLRHVLDS